MIDNETSSSTVWSRYRQAKQEALAAPGGEAEPDMTLEELERAIAELAASSGMPETGMPPRSTVHPAKRLPVSLWFYSTLLFLFAALVIGMIWWGREMYG